MSEIRFVTLFPKCTKVELFKDVGQIPYNLAKNYESIISSIALYDIDVNDDEIKEFSKNVNIVKIKKLFNNDNLSRAYYILTNATKIDWLNIYHPGRCTLVLMKLFKFLNPKGKVYIKTDASFEICKELDEKIKKRRVFNTNTKVADLITAEAIAVKERLQIYSDKNIKLVHNGYIEPSISNANREKEEVFLTVGRLGTEQKATDILLKAFALTADKHNWKLKLVGSIEPEFKTYIDEYFKAYPWLKEKVIFTGAIFDKSKLYDEYSKAKVFVLPSLYEGFPLVGPEALYNGCRFILSDAVPPFSEFTDNGKYGIKVKTGDVQDLADAFVYEANREYNPEEIFEMKTYCEKLFSWDNICENLYNYMIENE